MDFSLRSAPEFQSEAQSALELRTRLASSTDGVVSGPTRKGNVSLDALPARSTVLPVR
jgi:hypothetical protein